MGYINNARYGPVNTTFETERLNKSRKDNMQFLQGRSPSLLEKFSSFIVCIAQALVNITFGRELI